MDRIAALVLQADTLRKRIYSSLPFVDRLADLLTKLAVSTVETLGRAIGAEFLERGVSDMPDPGPRWSPTARNPALTLPADYMRDFASKLYGVMIRKFHDVELVDDAVQSYLTKVLTREMIKPVPRRAAESYVIDGVIKMALDILRHRGRKERPGQTDPLDAPEVEGRTLQEKLEDPWALRNMEHKLSPRLWQRWMMFLAAHLHEDIPTFIGLHMQGYDNDEIVGDPKKGLPGKLPHYQAPMSGPNSYLQHYAYKIPELSKLFFKSLREELPLTT